MGALLLLLALVADPQIEALRSQLESMRGRVKVADGPRGATPELTEVKHKLRDWIESRLNSFPRAGDAAELARELNAELKAAKLTCNGSAACDTEFPIGYLAGIKTSFESGFLVVQTSVQILCGVDDSAYLYTWSDEGWRRVWQSEQNQYTEAGYKPQTLQSVILSPYTTSNEYVALTLGVMTWCTSNWRGVYYRAFRLGPDAAAAPLVDGEEPAYLGGDLTIAGSVSRDDALVEFVTGSIDGGLLTRTAVRHFDLTSNPPRRVDPVALTPRNFVDEWLAAEWQQLRRWTDNPAATAEWHRKLRKVRGEFLPTKHCTDQADTWQVAAELPAPTFFLVRWRPPYRFTMLGISAEPSPNCKEDDPDADEPQTLFHGWRQR